MEADVKLLYSSYFYLDKELDISFKLSPLQTIWIKCQTLFWWKFRKNILKCHLLELRISVVQDKSSMMDRKASDLIVLLWCWSVSQRNLLLWAPCNHYVNYVNLHKPSFFNKAHLQELFWLHFYVTCYRRKDFGKAKASCKYSNEVFFCLL